MMASGPGLNVPVAAGRKRILILGGGFSGAYTARYLEKLLGGVSDIEVAVVSKENFVLFTPMLHEVAGSDLEVTDIVQPLRKMLRHTRIAIASIEAIDPARKQVRVRHPDLPDAYEVAYDHLVLALGAVTNFYHTPGLEEHAFTMKTLGDAIRVRNGIINALELADNQSDETRRRTTLTAVVAGGGFAGAETVGAINDFMREGLQLYPHLTEDMIRVVLVHPGAVILPELGESLGRYAQKKLGERGVEILLNTKVSGFDGETVTLGDGTAISSRMLIWTAGTTPAPVISNLPCALERGRVVVNEYLEVPDLPGVWALGDCALIPDPLNPGKFYPPTAQHAVRQADALAKNIVATLRGEQRRPFEFKVIGLLASIGRRCGVAEILGMRFSGIIAWWLWRGIYLAKLPGFPKKVRVALDWTLDLFFSKNIVQLPMLTSPSISVTEKTSAATSHSAAAANAPPDS